MKLIFKQRFFSWFGNYDVYSENGEVVYRVQGKFALGRCFKIYDTNDNELGMVKGRVFTLLPKFDIYMGGKFVGSIHKAFTFLRPVFNIDYNGWYVEGDILGWDYDIIALDGSRVATVRKEIFNLTDTYTIDVVSPYDSLSVLMLVLAIDAEKESRD